MTSTILVIDDDPDVLDGMGRVLRLHGYQVAPAVDGAEALAWLASAPAPPALILLDLHMPVLDGRGFLEAIARIPRYPGVPVVVASGAEDVTDQLRGLPVDAVLRKPVRPVVLVKLVADILGRSPEP
jgi:CheY-like chemotaxis protein